MTRLFISYRREDTIDITGRIYDRLIEHFGHDSVFMDVDTIPYGVDFRHYLNDWITQCDAVIIVIGERWLDANYESGPKTGKRRLDDPADFVRIEVAAALRRGIPVVPVVVGKASMPDPDQLPQELVDLAYRHAAEVRSGRDFHGHMERLIQGLERLLKASQVSQSNLPSKQDRFSAAIPNYPQLQKQGADRVAVDPPAVIMPTNLGFDEAEAGGMPSGWFNSLGYVSGVSPAYEIKVLPRNDYAGGQCVRIHRAGAHEKEFGALMQRCPAQNFIGKFIRFEGDLRTQNLSSWAGLWLRLDGSSGHLFFDNMNDRPIRGSTPWTKYYIETHVPEGSEWINYGVLLVSDGTVWADNFALEVRDVDDVS